LLLIFPAFGYLLVFTLGVSDFVLLALFAIARHLGIRFLPTLTLGCAAGFLTVLADLLVDLPLPALPFISLVPPR
jgi:hypothetical protein